MSRVEEVEVYEKTRCTQISEQTSLLVNWLPWADSHAVDGLMAVALGLITRRIAWPCRYQRLGVREKKSDHRERRCHLHERLEPGVECY
jgi:hypothetical protein